MSRPRDHSREGGMLAVGLSEHDSIEELKPFQGQLCIAAVNSPTSVTVSGDLDAVKVLQTSLSERGIFNRILQVRQAFHSHHMLPLAPSYESALDRTLPFKTTDGIIRMYSSVTSRIAVPEEMGPGYWAQNMVLPVRFADALTGILLDEDEKQIVDVLVEM